MWQVIISWTVDIWWAMFKSLAIWRRKIILKLCKTFCENHSILSISFKRKSCILLRRCRISVPCLNLLVILSLHRKFLDPLIICCFQSTNCLLVYILDTFNEIKQSLLTVQIKNLLECDIRNLRGYLRTAYNLFYAFN